jgi:hypothetical protein
MDRPGDGLDAGVAGAGARGLRPAAALTISEWAETYRVWAGRSVAEAGRYRIVRTPYIREPLDCLSEGSPNTLSANRHRAGARRTGIRWHSKMVTLGTSAIGSSGIAVNAPGTVVQGNAAYGNDSGIEVGSTFAGTIGKNNLVGNDMCGLRNEGVVGLQAPNNRTTTGVPRLAPGQLRRTTSATRTMAQRQ